MTQNRISKISLQYKLINLLKKIIIFHFLSALYYSVHSMPERLRLGLPFTLIRHENRAIRKYALQNRSNLKTPAFHFLVNVMGLFENDEVTPLVSDRVFRKHKSERTGERFVFYLFPV